MGPTIKMQDKINVLVWDENPGHAPKDVYPDGIRGAIAQGLNELGGDSVHAYTAHLDDLEQGVSEHILEQTDVLIWWSHGRNPELHDSVAERIYRRVHDEGMGFIALHSAHSAKPLQWILACTGNLKGGWREVPGGEAEEIRVCAPWHPIASGVTDFVLPHEEMYGAPFETPAPKCVVFQSHFPHGGETFPSGLCWTVGRGKDPHFTNGPGGGIGEGDGIGRVFYFRPGHEEFPTYFDTSVRQLLFNAVLWCAKRTG